MVIGPGSVNLSLRRVCTRAALASAVCTEPLRRIGRGDGRHLGLVAVGANADHGLARKIDAVEIGKEAVHEMRARLLAVADDVDAGILLELHGEHRRVELALLERLSLEPPSRPEPLLFGEPDRLRKAACDRRLEHLGGLDLRERGAIMPEIAPLAKSRICIRGLG